MYLKWVLPTNLEIGAAQLHSVTEIAPKSQLFLFVNRRPILYGVRAGGAKTTRFSVNIVPRWLFRRNAVIICAKVTFHWFSSTNNPLNSLKLPLPLKPCYSVVKKSILYCTQYMKYSTDNTRTMYIYVLLWKLKKNSRNKKRSTWQLESFLSFHLDTRNWHEWFHTGLKRTKIMIMAVPLINYFHISFFVVYCCCVCLLFYQLCSVLYHIFWF